MDRQSWFEKNRIKPRLELIQRYYAKHSEQALEDWKILRLALIRIAMGVLTGFEKNVIKRTFFKGRSEREVAKEMKVSASKIHRAKWRALKKMTCSAYLKLLFSSQSSLFEEICQ